ncbi:MAG: metallophosphoesterase family protein [Phycisphaerae bacterium]|nr:metallophosphoesterase family protein [Phycisphaerae bacterium]
MVRSIAVCVMLVCMVSLSAPAAEVFDPPAVYLTWQRDPTTTMTVHWHTIHDLPAPDAAQTQAASEPEDQPSPTDIPPDWEVPASVVLHRPLAEAAGEWKTTAGKSHRLPYSNRMVHTVELTGLTPATDYRFRFNENSAEFRFRTMPEDVAQPIRFAVGGDTMHRPEDFEAVNRQAARMSPEFVVFGGDLAYADAKPDQLGRWYTWFEVYKRSMVTPDGRLIPMLVTIGNHEVRGGTGGTPEKAPFFFNLFAMPGLPGYASLDFGDYMSILLLDTDHVNPIDGPQTGWLARTLLQCQRRGVPHLFPVYHVPAYPGHREFAGHVNARVRDYWVPLFEEFGIRVAFEHHDHTYKRTHPLRGGRIDARGIVYLGDGAWGVGVRKPAPDRWYLQNSAHARHLILVTIHGRHQHYLVIDETGAAIDEFPSTPSSPRLHEPTAPALAE